MKTRSLIIAVLLMAVCALPCVAGVSNYHLKIYYDDLDIIYRNGGTMQNVVERADYIIEVIGPKILIKIPGPNTFRPTQIQTIDIRIRCDLTTPSGELVSYGFDKSGTHMNINDKIYQLDRILLKEIVKHLPISQKEKLFKHFGL